MGKTRFAAAALLALSLLAGGVVYQQTALAEGREPRHRFTLIARETNVQFLDNQPGQLAPGDRFVVRSNLLRGDKVVGEDHVSCTAMFDNKILCNSAYVVHGRGALMGQGLVTFGAREFDIAIIGGTGDYRTARGVVHITVLQPQPPNRVEELRFELVP